MRALALILALSPVTAHGQERTCEASIEGEARELTYDPSEAAVAQNTTLTESALRRFGADACPGYVVLRELTPDLTDAERGPFCLAYDREAETYAGFSEGQRDSYGICTDPKTLCDRVNATAEQARTSPACPRIRASPTPPPRPGAARTR